MEGRNLNKDVAQKESTEKGIRYISLSCKTFGKMKNYTCLYFCNNIKRRH